jgi:hypothetical protein
MLPLILKSDARKLKDFIKENQMPLRFLPAANTFANYMKDAV